MIRTSTAAIALVFVACLGLQLSVYAQDASTVSDGIETIGRSQNPPPAGVQWPRALTSHVITAADYPPESIRRREQGTVVVRYVVLEDGTVGNVEILRSSGIQRLDDATITFVMKFRFAPGTRDGKPIRVRQGSGISWEVRRSR